MPGPNDPHDPHFQHPPGSDSGFGWAILNAERMAEQQQAIQAATQQVAMAQAAAAMQAAQLVAITPVPVTSPALVALQELAAAHTAQLAAHQATLNLITAALTKPTGT